MRMAMYTIMNKRWNLSKVYALIRREVDFWDAGFKMVIARCGKFNGTDDEVSACLIAM